MGTPVTVECESLTAADVHLVSYGRVRSAWFRAGTDKAQSRSLSDPAIFGPEADYACQCRQFVGREYADMVCEKCGVKVGKARVLRRRRWGHIDLPVSVRHPLVAGARVNAVPVLPIAYRDPERYGDDLNALYVEVLQAAQGGEAGAAEQETAVARLFCNDWLAAPRRHDGRVLRSIAYYLFEWPGRTDRDVGVYMRALMLTPRLGDSGGKEG